MSLGDKDDGRDRKLEIFDGSNPANYKKWRRRAELHLLSLPSTFSKEKWGPKLLEYVHGEAEETLEDLSIEKITKEDGYKQILAILDDKYKERQQDELHHALKEYFYTVTIKQGETYRNFLVRLDTAYRKLVQHGVELPSEVQGWFLMRKLHLESSAEAMILTSTSGSIKREDVLKAVKAIFPNGKGGNVKKSDVFVAEDPDATEAEVTRSQVTENDDDEFQEVLEAVAEQIQMESEYEDDDALEVFETYREVRKKLQEKKVSRGFKGKGKAGQAQQQQWQLSGSVRGRIELIKSRTKCHNCGQLGHWKKECPARTKKNSTGVNQQATTGHEVHYTDYQEVFDEYSGGMAAEVLINTAAQSTKSGKGSGKKHDKQDTWQVMEELGQVWRVHRKPRKGLFAPEDPSCPVEVKKLTARRTTEVRYDDGTTEVRVDDLGKGVDHQSLGRTWTGITKFEVANRHGADSKVADEDAIYDTNISEEVLIQFEQQVLSEGLEPRGNDRSEVLLCEQGSVFEHAVPDTACRKSLVGEYTLQGLQQCLRGRGYSVKFRKEVNDFRFGNAGVIRSEWVAKIPLCFGGQTVNLHAAVLPEGGKHTPLLLSKECLKWLGCRLDMVNDEGTTPFRCFPHHDRTVTMSEAKSAQDLQGNGRLRCPAAVWSVAMSKVEVSELARKMMTSLNIDEKGAKVIIEKPDLDDAGDKEEDEPGHPIPGTMTMTCGKYGKARRDVSSIYQMDKGYVQWVRAHINTESAEPMKKLRLYIECRDIKKSARLEQEVLSQPTVKNEHIKPKGYKTEPKQKATTKHAKTVEEQKEHIRVSLMALKDWLHTATEQRQGEATIKEITDVIAVQEAKLTELGSGTSSSKRSLGLPSQSMELEGEGWEQVAATEPSAKAQRMWAQLTGGLTIRDQQRRENIKRSLKETGRVLQQTSR
ncbi:unnamed protein product [Symbiodinium sp. CCMP2592]|nr:unnamed protein product [Symbiodinium sp. CCMP2592]